MSALKELIRQCLAVPQIGRPEYTAMVGKALQEISDGLDQIEKLNEHQQEINKQVIEVFAAHEKKINALERQAKEQAERSCENIEVPTVGARLPGEPLVDYKPKPPQAEPRICATCADTCKSVAVKDCEHWNPQPKPPQAEQFVKADEVEGDRREAEQGGDDYIDIVFDGPPSHEAGRFVEVEDSTGASMNYGEWVDRGNGYWVLRIADLRARLAEAEKERDHYKAFAGSQRFMSDFQNADQMREEIDRLRAENAELKAMVQRVIDYAKTQTKPEWLYLYTIFGCDKSEVKP